MPQIVQRARVLNLYRQLLALTEEIPIDHLRPQRQFSIELRQHIIDQFKANKDLAIESPLTLQKIEEAEVQAEALESLIDNKYHDEFPLSSTMLNPASNPSYYEKLVKDIDSASSSKKPTFRDYLKAFFR